MFKNVLNLSDVLGILQRKTGLLIGHHRPITTLYSSRLEQTKHIARSFLWPPKGKIHVCLFFAEPTPEQLWHIACDVTAHCLRLATAASNRSNRSHSGRACRQQVGLYGVRLCYVIDGVPVHVKLCVLF